MSSRLEGKIAIITGAARGTGEQTARLFVDEGARVVIADVLEAEGRAVAEDLGDCAAFVRLDVTSEQSWVEGVGETKERFGGATVLVTNAGLLPLEAAFQPLLEELFHAIQQGWDNSCPTERSFPVVMRFREVDLSPRQAL